MKEIKFRAWLPTIKKMTNSHPLEELMDWNLNIADSKAPIWMQLTGLKDKNGKEIYEGDIVDCFAGEHYNGIWEYQKRFAIEFGCTESMWEMLNCDLIEVIGNVYENPELMDASEQ